MPIELSTYDFLAKMTHKDAWAITLDMPNRRYQLCVWSPSVVAPEIFVTRDLANVSDIEFHVFMAGFQDIMTKEDDSAESKFDAAPGKSDKRTTER